MKRLLRKTEKPTQQHIQISLERAKHIEEKQKLLYQDYQDVYDVFKDLCIKN